MQVLLLADRDSPAVHRAGWFAAGAALSWALLMGWSALRWATHDQALAGCRTMRAAEQAQVLGALGDLHRAVTSQGPMMQQE